MVGFCKFQNLDRISFSESPVTDTVQSQDAPLILPKIQKNYLLENKKLITEHKIQQKHKPKAEQSQAKHKDYGKTPEYLEKYKKEDEIKKERIRKYKEEQEYSQSLHLECQKTVSF